MLDLATSASAPTVGRAPLIVVNGTLRKAAVKMLSRWQLEDRVAGAASKAPAVPDAVERLAVYLPELITIPYERKPLFVACVEEGLARMEGAGDPLEQFLLGVMGKAHFVLRYDLVGSAGRWNPISSEPLAVWFASNRTAARRGTKFTAPWPPVSINDFTNALFDRLIPEGEYERPLSIKEFIWP